ncbi:hypothetical protein IT400_01425 [Candidatus Nomurabacteria bacterium]|nr:hypothetical protein [Candidatus Nomurabacteria bacterium]
MEPIITQEFTVKEKFWVKKKILWAILTVIAIALVAFVLIQKYRIDKPINNIAEKEKQIFMELSQFSKETNDDPVVNGPILKDISESSEVKKGDEAPIEKYKDIFQNFSE